MVIDKIIGFLPARQCHSGIKKGDGKHEQDKKEGLSRLKKENWTEVTTSTLRTGKSICLDGKTYGKLQWLKMEPVVD